MIKVSIKGIFLKLLKDPKTALIKELKQEIFKLRELLAKTASLTSLHSNPSLVSEIFLFFFFSINNFSQRKETKKFRKKKDLIYSE